VGIGGAFSIGIIMSTSLAFDTLAYAKRLEKAGVPEAQAEVQAETLAEIVEERLATKRDLKEMEASLARDLREIEMRLTIKLGTMLVIAIGVFATLVKLL